MLVEFRVVNFRSFKEEQVFSMVASKDESHPENLIRGEKFNLLKAAGLYGANASGKSNFIKALSCMYAFISLSTSMNIGDEIRGITPFCLDKQTKKEPSLFEITYLDEGDRYVYGFATTTQKVFSEWLYWYPKATNRQNVIFEREYNSKKKSYSLKYNGSKKQENTIAEFTRENGLALSRGAELNIEKFKEVFLWLKKNIRILNMSEPPKYLIKEVALQMDENPKYGDMVLRMIQHADMGIDKLEVEKVKYKEIQTRVGAYKVIKGKGGQKEYIDYQVKSYHKTEDGKQIEFDWEKDESNGTKRFITLAGTCLDTMERGTILIIDEIETSMHPLLMWKFVELFQSEKVNNNGGQLIFATHASEVMDLDLFRRDQIWIVEKKRGGDSELYSIYDFATKDRPRNREALLQRKYLAGRYGGVPNFGPIFEDMEF